MAFLLRSLAPLIVLSLLAGPALSAHAPGAPVPTSRSAQAAAENAPDEMLVTCRAELPDAVCRTAIGVAGQTVLRRFRLASDPGSPLNRLYVVRIDTGQSLDEALLAIRLLPEVEAAQPNHVYRVLQTPDDPYYYLQWGQENLGGSPAFDGFGLPGPDPWAPGADMDALPARDLYESWVIDPVIVGVTDTGMDLDHPDLAAVIWTNPGELPGDGVDDDSNGYADDVHGWDFVNDDNDPDDPDGHGTHVAGAVGASGNNGTGVAGTAPNARLMPLRFVDEDGSGFTDDLIDGILYGIDNGARVLNISSGGGVLDPALQDAIAAAGLFGVLVVASAGNETSDNDLVPVYPASFDNDNIISVAASTPWRDLADFSNWGIDSVDLAAPGDEIISTTPADGSPGVPETAYQIAYDIGYPGLVSWGGTSMAAPAVAGAAALVFGLGDTLWPDSWNTLTPVEQMHAVRDRILNRTERWASFDGKTATDGHLNLHSLVEEDLVPPDPCGPSLQIAARGPDSVTLRWMATGDDGAVGTANYYDLRYQQGDTIDFASATSLHDVWTPGPPGSFETYTLAGLLPDSDYTFGLVVVDNVGNPSALTALTVTTLPPVVPPPTVVLFEDRFDDNGCGNWDLAGTWGCETDSLSDSPGADYPINNRASARLSPLSFEGAQAVEVAFDLVSFGYEEGWDYLYFQYSLDGTSWRTLGSYTGSAGGMQLFNLPELAGMPAVWFRFLSLSDYVYSFDGARIDDFQVSVTKPPTCGSDPDCDDANVCTIDTCDIVTGDCYSTPIPGCEDTDADGVEDSVDNCLAMPNGPYGGTCVSGPVGAPCAGADDCFDGETYGLCSLAQENLDGDGDGDACDPDQDGDGVDAAAGDCDDRNALVWPGAEEVCDELDNDCDGITDNAAPPSAVQTLSFEANTLSWEPVDGATGYDVVAGDLVGLAELGFEGTTLSCLAENTEFPEIDPEDPPAGEGRWYLVRGANCGGAGSYGSGNPPRSPSRDEAIALSGNDCLP